MLVQNNNILELLQGKWLCIACENKTLSQNVLVDIELLISENLISCLSKNAENWPPISKFDPIGSVKAGYFYREDGCFLQVKSISKDSLCLQLSKKDDQGDLLTIVYDFERKEI